MMAAAGNGWKRASAYDMKVCLREEFRGIHAGRQVKTPLGGKKNHSWKEKLNGRAGAKNKKRSSMATATPQWRWFPCWHLLYIRTFDRSRRVDHCAWRKGCAPRPGSILLFVFVFYSFTCDYSVHTVHTVVLSYKKVSKAREKKSGLHRNRFWEKRMYFYNKINGNCV